MIHSHFKGSVQLRGTLRRALTQLEWVSTLTTLDSSPPPQPLLPPPKPSFYVTQRRKKDTDPVWHIMRVFTCWSHVVVVRVRTRRCVLTDTIPRFVSAGTLLCFLGDRVSQITEPSHVQLRQCNPNTGRNAKSSLPAVVSHPSFCAALRRNRGLGRTRAGLSRGTRPTTSSRVNAASVLASFPGPVQFLLTVTLSECGRHGSGEDEHRQTPLHNCSDLSLIGTGGGSVNMTFSVCVQRQHEC